MSKKRLNQRVEERIFGRKDSMLWQRYSQLLEAAWEVVEHLKQFDTEHEGYLNTNNKQEYRFMFIERGTCNVVGQAFASTLPEAICLAALRALKQKKVNNDA